MAIKTIIVDDEPLAREKLRGFLEKENDVEIIGECRDGREALETIEGQGPDLVFLDVQMPEMDGFEVLENLEPEGLPTVYRGPYEYSHPEHDSDYWPQNEPPKEQPA